MVAFWVIGLPPRFNLVAARLLFPDCRLAPVNYGIWVVDVSGHKKLTFRTTTSKFSNNLRELPPRRRNRTHFNYWSQPDIRHPASALLDSGVP